MALELKRIRFMLNKSETQTETFDVRDIVVVGFIIPEVTATILAEAGATRIRPVTAFNLKEGVYYPFFLQDETQVSFIFASEQLIVVEDLNLLLPLQLGRLEFVDEGGELISYDDPQEGNPLPDSLPIFVVYRFLEQGRGR